MPLVVLIALQMLSYGSASGSIVRVSEPTLTERRSPSVVVTRADDPWVAAEVVKLHSRGGTVVRLPGRRLREPDYSVFKIRFLTLPPTAACR